MVTAFHEQDLRASVGRHEEDRAFPSSLRPHESDVAPIRRKAARKYSRSNGPRGAIRDRNDGETRRAYQDVLTVLRPIQGAAFAEPAWVGPVNADDVKLMRLITQRGT